MATNSTRRFDYWPEAWEMQRKQLKFSIPIIEKRDHKMKYYLQEAIILPINNHTQLLEGSVGDLLK
jgi:hypothetical protein